jgi:predicted DNA-binding transcriptional regulator AlpA
MSDHPIIGFARNPAELRALSQKVPMPVADNELMSAEQVAKRCRMPVLILHKLVRSGDFPRPISGVRPKRWQAGEVRDWLYVKNRLTKAAANSARGERSDK